MTGPLASAAAVPLPVTNWSVFATGLNNPRGLKFGHDGYLYVAEGGVGGTDSTAGQCQQVQGPIGPYTGSATGARISRIDEDGTRATLAEALPSSQSAPTSGGFVSGVADIAFIGRDLYALLAGAGCSHGVAGMNNAVLRLDVDRGFTQVIDLSAYLQASPVAQPDPNDYEPDGTWYSMVEMDGALYALEPHQGELDRVTPDGRVSRVVDISASQGHIVPTALAVHAGAFYVGNLGRLPAQASSRILRIGGQGQVSVVATGLTAVLGVTFDAEGRLLVLEASAPAAPSGPSLVPGTGRVLRIGESGDRQVVTLGLTLPTAMAYGPDGDLYIANKGFGAPAGGGQIVRVRYGAA